MKKSRIHKLLPFLIVISLVIAACKDDDNPSPSITNEDNAYVNNWIEEEMKYWYLWNDKLSTGDKNQNPEDYFQSLLYEEEDRFSWIQENYQELLNSLQGVNKEAGYEYVLYLERQGGENVIAQILYVKPGSPAESAGLVRGDIITHINSQQITRSNYRTLTGQLGENHTITYKSINPETQTQSEAKSASLSPVVYSENPNYLSKTIERDGKKIGYYVYNLFAGGPTDESKSYDNQMDEIFTDFKNKGINELVLDLRYNSGGAESSARNLSSLIGKGVSSSKTFARREYNTNLNQAIINDPKYGEAFLTSKFADKASNIGNQLNRLYVLTSSRSASASELVINSLKPYMDVIIIGDTTYGKNVGSVSLYEENDPKNTWGMQPIVVKIYNSQNQSDYTRGFVPNILDLDNSLYIYPLGDERERLLAQAIGQITGTSTLGRTSRPVDGKKMVGHSLDQKLRSFNLIIDRELIP